MTKNFKKISTCLIFTLIVYILDQYSKYLLIDRMFERTDILVFTGFFNLVFVKNLGISFGILADKEINQLFFIALNLSVSFVLLAMMFKFNGRINLFALSIVLGGALGNVTDRIIHNGVIDFLDFHYGNWHYPAFNLADSFICLGVFLLLIGESESTPKPKKS